MKRVIFVGINNKPGMDPLDSRTKSGKLIDRIIEELDKEQFDFIKSNLYDYDDLPKDKFLKYHLTETWHYRIKPKPDDIIILLGKDVHKNFLRQNLKHIIEATHPGRIFSNLSKDAYVTNAIKSINKIVNQ